MAEIFKINDIEFECEFKLKNSDDQEVTYTKSAIRGMVIIDNVFEPFMNGNISVANPFDHMEREFFIRGDGRDKFLIKFKPKKELFKPGEEQFEHTFVVVDDTDVGNPLARSENYKILNLLSIDAVPFIDKIPYGKIYTGKVGKILKDIFIEMLGEDRVSSDIWQEGDFELTYSPPATFRYMDMIRYLLRIYYAKDGDMYVKGFINLDKKTNKYQLELLSKIFKDNKNYEMEAFAVGDLISQVGFNNPNNPVGGTPTSEYASALKNFGYSMPLYNWNSDYIINSLVIGYDKMLGQQKIRKLDLEEVRKKWKDKFVDSFKAKQGKPKESLVKNKSTDKRFKRYKFPYPVEDGVKIVESEIHNNLTFLNLQLNFTNIGGTHRSSGKFIDIFTPKKGDQDFKSHQKILGRWYVTEIRHIFSGEIYTNAIYATKTYIGPNAKIKDDVE